MVALGYCRYCYRRILNLGADLNQARWIYCQEYEAICRTQKELADFCISFGMFLLYAEIRSRVDFVVFDGEFGRVFVLCHYG